MKRRDFFYLSTILVLLCLWVRSCGSRNETMSNGKDLLNYKDTAEYYRSKSGKLVASNQALHMSYADAKYYIDSLQAYIKDLRIKKPDVIVRTVTKLRVDSIPVPFKVELPCDEFSLVTRVDSAWYGFDVRLTKRSLNITNLEIPNRQETVIGMKKMGFLKRPEYTVAVLNSNPYMHVESIGALTIKPKPPVFDRWWFKSLIFGAGFVGGRIIR